jgi:uncharacterized phage protein gp47/JayE
MPYSRPTLGALETQVANDISSALPGADALLRFSNLQITGKAQAALANLHYGYLDWISKQAVPFTCTDEFLEGWAALKGVIRQNAIQATGAVTFAGAEGTPIPAGTSLSRGDGIDFTTLSAGTVSGGFAVVNAVANADLSGLTGAFGNTLVGVAMTLAQSIPGVQSSGAVSTAFVGGADLETNDSLRSRMLAAFQTPPQGGDRNDYVDWALDVPGVTRAWCAPNGFGAGTIVIYFMMDSTRAGFGGFPQGTNGVAAADAQRAAPATGDQLAVANAVFDLQAAVALVYQVAPKPYPSNFTIQGIPSALQPAVEAAIEGAFLTQAAPGVTLSFGNIWAAIANAAAGNFFTVTPTTDIAPPIGYLPVLGAAAFS